jgi:hypothetical protein
MTGDWTMDAACAGAASGFDEPDMPAGNNYAKRHQVARAYVRAARDAGCNGCPVIADCLLFGVTNRQSGIYGGHLLNGGALVHIPRLAPPRNNQAVTERAA